MPFRVDADFRVTGWLVAVILLVLLPHLATRNTFNGVILLLILRRYILEASALKRTFLGNRYCGVYCTPVEFVFKHVMERCCCCCCCLHIKSRSGLYSVLSNIRTGPTDVDAFRGHRLTTQKGYTYQKEIKGPVDPGSSVGTS